MSEQEKQLLYWAKHWCYIMNEIDNTSEDDNHSLGALFDESDIARSRMRDAYKESNQMSAQPQTPQERIAKVEWEVGMNDKVTFVHLPFEDVIWLLSVARAAVAWDNWFVDNMQDGDLFEISIRLHAALYATPEQTTDPKEKEHESGT